MSTISLVDPRLHHVVWQRRVKQTLDIVFAATLLVLLAPFFVAIAMAIKLGDGGPVFYHWKVVGKDGRPFTGYKFRSMVANADALKAPLAVSNEMTGPVFKMRDDPRVTRIGRLLRKYSLDELPQLWSVLKGDMSLVGPRPPLESEYAHFAPWHRRKLAVVPGITGLWQISGRNKINDFDDWVDLELAYIEHWSPWLDLQILVETIPAVARGRGAS